MKKLTRILSNVWWQIFSVVVLIVVITLSVFNVNSRDATISELREENYRLQKALEYSLNRNDIETQAAALSKKNAGKKK